MNTDFQFDRDTHTFTHSGVVRPSITQVLAMAGIVDFSFVEEERRTYYLKRGKSVHWLLQLEDEGALNYRSVPHSLRPYRKEYRAWKANSGFVPTLIEKPMMSPLGFCGIPDRFGKLGNGSAVVELKTGAVSKWVGIQLAAQCMLLQPNMSLARTIRRIGLSLGPSHYKVTEFPLSTFDRDTSIFIDALKKVAKNGY